jgi:hypothetical protein
MIPDPLDRKLDAYSRQPLPASPHDVDAEVWREIERRREQPLAARLGWHELLRQPWWAVAGLTFAIAIGTVSALAFNRVQQTKRLARDSLHLDVFLPRARGLPASVLAKPDSITSQRHLP